MIPGKVFIVPRHNWVEFIHQAMWLDTSRGSNTFLGSCWSSEKFKRRNQLPGSLSECILLIVAPSLLNCCGCLLKNNICKGWKTSTGNMLWMKPPEHLQSYAPMGDSTEPYWLWGLCEVLWGLTPVAMRLPMAARLDRLVRRVEVSVSVYQFLIFIFSKYLVQNNWPSIVWERWGTGWE